jgi:serpin B
MARKTFAGLALAAVLAAGTGLMFTGAPRSAAVASGGPPPSPVSEANNTFAADLYAKLSAEEGNLFFSPNSIETALVMTSAGARGKTLDEMKKVLGLTFEHWTFDKGAEPDVHREFSTLLKRLNAEKGADGKPRPYQLSIANALWGQKGFTFLPEFTEILEDNYGARLSNLDFKADTESARKSINAWVEKQTSDKIKDLLKPGVLTGDTRLVLTNAIYFKGKWAEPFEKAGTKEDTFHLAGGKDVKTPLMNRTGKCWYLETDDYQAVKLPYAGDALAMVIILPKKVDGLAAVEKSFSLQYSGLRGYSREEVVLSLPKFTMTCEFNLAKTLAAMGMKDAFDPGAADFSGMDGKKGLFISAVVHKAFVDVNEEGTEAAAATGVAIAPALAVIEPKPPKVFKADHPFLFLIGSEAGASVLFMGRVSDPTK